MTKRKVFLARHGETIYGRELRFIGRTDVDLSETGQAQAKWLGEQLKDVKFTGIFTSPLLRCRKTAKAVAAHHELEPVVVDDLAEIDLGEWEDMTLEEIEEKWPDEVKKRRPLKPEFGPPGGEKWGDVQKRVVAAIEKLCQDAPKGPIFIAAHRGANGVFICHVMDLPLAHLFNIENDYGCLNIINYFDGKPSIELLNWTGQQDEDFMEDLE